MIDALFRSAYYAYLEFFPSSAAGTLAGAIIDSWLLLISNALNAYIYMTFNKYVTLHFLNWI